MGQFPEFGNELVSWPFLCVCVCVCAYLFSYCGRGVYGLGNAF